MHDNTRQLRHRMLPGDKNVSSTDAFSINNHQTDLCEVPKQDCKLFLVPPTEAKRPMRDICSTSKEFLLRVYDFNVCSMYKQGILQLAIATVLKYI